MNVFQQLCGIRGHVTVKQTEDNEVFLRCLRCLYRSQGWSCPIRITVWSTKDLQQACCEMLDAELSLHGGG